MARKRSHTRRSPRSNPRGVLTVHGGGFGFVQTAEGAYFVPASKMAGAFDGDLVEVAPLPSAGGKGGARQPHQGAARPATSRPRGCCASSTARTTRSWAATRWPSPSAWWCPRMRAYPTTSSPCAPTIRTCRTARSCAFASLRSPRATPRPPAWWRRLSGRRATRGWAWTSSWRATSWRRRSRTVRSPRRAPPCSTRAGALAEGYRDLRERFTLTIDPADARDFDDALSLEPVDLESGKMPRSARFVDERGPGAVRWRLGVHIADVSHYVPWNSSIDLDARRRATSVYLADRVIPMLPEELSGDLCSLKPGEVRRTMTADLYLDDGARLVGYELYPALIRSDARADLRRGAGPSGGAGGPCRRRSGGRRARAPARGALAPGEEARGGARGGRRTGLRHGGGEGASWMRRGTPWASTCAARRTRRRSWRRP